MLTFGKWKNQPLVRVPTGYLRWCLAECHQLDPWARSLVQAELRRRGERYVNASAFVWDCEETLTAAIASDPAIDLDTAGALADHVMTAFEEVRRRHGIGQETELVIPADRSADRRGVLPDWRTTREDD